MMQGIIKKCIFPACIVIAVAILIRLLYLSFSPTLIDNADSYGYYKNAYEILHSKQPISYIINDNRTPGYPLLLALILQPSSYLEEVIIQPSYTNTSNLILFTNFMFGVFTVLATMIILYLVKTPVIMSYIIGLIVATTPSLFHWKHFMLPESTAIFLITLLSLLYILSLKNYENVLYGGVQFVLGVILFLAKPVFLVIPFITFFFSYVLKPTKKRLMLFILSTILYTALLCAYIYGNSRLNGYTGINHTTDINILGRIIQANIPITGDTKSEYFKNKISEWKRISSDYQPYRFLEWADNYYTVWTNKPLLQELQIFTHSVVRSHLLVYLTKTLPDIPMILTNNGVAPDMIIFHNNMSFLSFFRLLAAAHQILRYSFFILLFFIPFAIWFFIKLSIRQGMLPLPIAFFIFSMTVISYIVLATAFGAYNDIQEGNGIGRIISPIIPIAYIALGLGIRMLYIALFSHKQQFLRKIQDT